MRTTVRVMILIFSTVLSLYSQTILPISLEIMRELQSSYQTGEIEEYVQEIIRGQKLSDEQFDSIIDEVSFFFESDQFLETGGAYLSSLFTPQELEEVLTVVKDSSLRNDPNFPGARRFELMMKRLKPYIVRYLRHKMR